MTAKNKIIRIGKPALRKIERAKHESWWTKFAASDQRAEFSDAWKARHVIRESEHNLQGSRLTGTSGIGTWEGKR